VLNEKALPTRSFMSIDGKCCFKVTVYKSRKRQGSGQAKKPAWNKAIQKWSNWCFQMKQRRVMKCRSCCVYYRMFNKNCWCYEPNM